jgi:hypothetical protein
VSLPPEIGYIEQAAYFKVGQRIEGDYCEFGVYTGRSFVSAYRAIIRKERARGAGQTGARYFAFDSFEGLPKPGARDLVYSQFAEGGLAATEEEFVTNLSKRKVDLSKVQIVRGWYSEILKPELPEEIGLSKVAIAMIDCDLYESVVPVLGFLTDLLVDGAVLIFDDWYLFKGNPQLGVQKAFRNWCAENPEIQVSDFLHVSGSFQRAFIISRPVNIGEAGEVSE